MPNDNFRQLRIWFSKTGNAKYISHLDLNRCMTRAVRRAHLPLWYTEGFNPHPYITFALPLSLGQESEAEPMDIRIQGEMENEEILNRLAAVMPEGISIFKVHEAQADAKEIRSAEYEICLDFEEETAAQSFTEKAGDLLANGGLTAQKSGKKGHGKVMKEVAISEHVLQYHIVNTKNHVDISVTLSAGNTVNLNPALLLESLNNAIGIAALTARIVRKRLLKADLTAFC